MLSDELAALQLFTAKQQRELDVAVLVAFKGLVGRDVFCQAIFLIFIIEIPHRHRGEIPTFSRSCQEAGSTTASCRMRACSIR